MDLKGSEDVTEIQRAIFDMSDGKYRDFQLKLIPNVNPDTVIGVRVPKLRKLAKELSRSPEGREFFNTLPHEYYEENFLHIFMIVQIKDFSSALSEAERFLPFIDNWAVCDSFVPKTFKEHRRELLPKIRQWLKSEHTYTVRFGIKMLMDLYLDGDFSAEYLCLVAGVRSEEYYVNMASAWYFATALAKQYDSALTILEKKILSPWVHNKTIQKAIESYRISAEKKEYLRTLR